MIAFALLIGLCGSEALAAAFSRSAGGTTAAEFLEIPATARAMALGDAQTAAAADASALRYNPARLAALEGGQAVFTHSVYLQDIFQGYAAVSHRVGRDGAVAAGFERVGYGDFEKIDNRGVATGDSFSPSDLAVGVAAALAIGDWAMGAGLKYISSQLVSSAETEALDLGVTRRLSRGSLALALIDLGPGLRFRQASNPLPTALRMGGYLPVGRLGLALDGWLSRGGGAGAGAGAEYAAPVGGWATVSVRIGFNTRAAFSKLGGLSGLAFGGGLGAGGLQFDYALADFGDLGLTHRMTAGLRWGGP